MGGNGGATLAGVADLHIGHFILGLRLCCAASEYVPASAAEEGVQRQAGQHEAEDEQEGDQACGGEATKGDQLLAARLAAGVSLRELALGLVVLPLLSLVFHQGNLHRWTGWRGLFCTFLSP